MRDAEPESPSGCSLNAATAVHDDGGCSSASVEFRLTATAGSQWFIRQTEDTDSPGGNWFTLFCPAMQTQLYSFFTESVPLDCRSCSQTTAIPIGLLTEPLPDGGATQTWNGLFFKAGNCGPMSAACLTPMCAAPGRYVAEMCACATNACPTNTCIEVPFNYPSATVVTGTLP